MKPLVIPLFIPNAGCSNTCIFCNQKVIAGKSEIPDEDEVDRAVVSHLETKAKKKKTNNNSPLPSTCKPIAKDITQIRLSLGIPQHDDDIMEIAFYGGSFTGMDLSIQKNLLKSAEKWIEKKVINGIRISTRPDLISEDILEMLKSHGVTTIELGAQSFSPSVLDASGRGHSPEKTIEASKLIKKNSFKLGIQLMMGLPGDTRKTFLESITTAISLNPDFARIYPVVILPKTKLIELYERGEYVPLSLEKTIELGTHALRRFYSSGIPVIRFGLPEEQGNKNNEVSRIGPQHPALKHLVDSRLAYVRMCAEISKLGTEVKDVLFIVPHRELSVFRGLKNENIRKMKTEFSLECKIIPEEFHDRKD